MQTITLKKAVWLAILVLLSQVLFSGCGGSETSGSIEDISILEEGGDPFELQCKDIADLLDDYISLKGHTVLTFLNPKRGTDKYATYLVTEAMYDEELQNLPEWNAIEIYINAYGDVHGEVNRDDLDDDALPSRMTGRTIRELTEDYYDMEPEEYESEV